MIGNVLRFRVLQEIYTSCFLQNMNNEETESYSNLSHEEKIDYAFRVISLGRELIKFTIPTDLPEIKQKELLFTALYKDDFPTEKFEILLNKLFNTK